MEQHWKIAAEVQASLLPAAALVEVRYRRPEPPAWDIGGDADYFPLEDGRLGLVIADVGSGVSAALLMATFRAALRGEVR
jgi:serine phosphatase RsbU (regulator of sigma subunit)